MKFRLTYDGELKAAGNRNNRRDDKAMIRRAIAPQLEELWETHPALRGTVLHTERPLVVHPRGEQTVRIAQPSMTPSDLNWPIQSGPRQFIPLVRSKLHLVCALDILFLRKEDPGGVIQGGDIDNRLKTLFDALSMPNPQDVRLEDVPRYPNLAAGVEPPHDAPPLECLMESDSLISGLTVTTDRLLAAPNASPSTVHLVIGVTVSVQRITDKNIGFIGD
jgi:hypothetical protein